MKSALLIIEFFIGISLIGAILLHQPKGEGLGGIGGQAKMYNYQRDMEAGLDKVTYVLASLFIAIAVLLSLIY